MKNIISLLFAVVIAASTPISLDNLENNANIYAKSSDSLSATSIETIIINRK